MLNQAKQELLDKLNFELDEIIAKYGDSIKQINEMANTQGVSFKDLDVEFNNKDSDISTVLVSLLRIYGEIQALRASTTTEAINKTES